MTEDVGTLIARLDEFPCSDYCECADCALTREAATALRASLTHTETLRTILADLLKDYDDESGTIRVGDNPGCPICTVGTVPNSQNTGPCAFHRARATLAGAQP